jgi:hypothetical protein
MRLLDANVGFLQFQTFIEVAAISAFEPFAAMHAEQSLRLCESSFLHGPDSISWRGKRRKKGWGVCLKPQS